MGEFCLVLSVMDKEHSFMQRPVHQSFGRVEIIVDG